MKEAIERIGKMEAILREAVELLPDLSAALERYAALQEDLQTLSDYYGSPDWFADLALDEEDMLPDDLKRGVLSEDGIYDLLEENSAVQDMMRELLE